MGKSNTKQVPFESLILDESFNSRTDYDEDYILSLKESIMTSGLLQPIGVTKRAHPGPIDDMDQYYVVYGFCRYKAIEKIREELGEDAFATLDVVLNEGTSDELRERNLKENIDRKNLKPHEISAAIKKMVNAGLEQRDIAARLGRPQSWVSYHYKVETKLGSAAKKAFVAGDLTLEQALNIADVPEDAQDEVVSKVLDADTRTEARTIAKKASKEKGKRRVYANKGRPTAKNMAQFVSDASFDAESNKMVAEDEAFYNGVAAGLRVALGDLDFEKLSTAESYTDVNYHAKGKEKKEKAAKKTAKKTTKKAKAKTKAKTSNGTTTKKKTRRKKATEKTASAS